jgi:hypothetical protein
MPMKTKHGYHRIGPATVVAVVCVLLFLPSMGLQAEGWCDLVFTDVVGEADSVIIAGYHQKDKSLPKFKVQEVLKGACTDSQLDLDLDEFAYFRLKDGDQLVLALTSHHQPVRVVHGMGGCTAVSVLPIRGGKLRSKDRENYDFGRKSITLEALRAELLTLLDPDSH